MSVLARRADRPNVMLRKVTRHSWGPDPSRVVVVAVLRMGDQQYARVIGSEDGRAVELERADAVSIKRSRPVTIGLADGGEWQLVGVGCSCNVPSALKGLNPIEVP